MSHKRAEAPRSDGALLASLRLGDAGALGELYDRHADVVLRYALSQMRNVPDAQEILQDTFVTAWDRRSRIRITGDSALPWLLATARNHALNLARRNQRRRSVVVDESRHDAWRGEPDLAWIQDALERLDPVDRRVCELCLVDGLSYREAAHELGLTVSALGKRLERSRVRLRKVALDNDN